MKLEAAKMIPTSNKFRRNIKSISMQSPLLEIRHSLDLTSINLCGTFLTQHICKTSLADLTSICPYRYSWKLKPSTRYIYRFICMHNLQKKIEQLPYSNMTSLWALTIAFWKHLTLFPVIHCYHCFLLIQYFQALFSNIFAFLTPLHIRAICHYLFRLS